VAKVPGGAPADPKMIAAAAGAGAAKEAAGANAKAGAAPGAAAANAGANPPGANAGAGARPAGDATGGNQNKPKPGSWEHAMLTFTEKVAEGDYSGLEYLITSKAKGLLAEIRDGEVSEERIEELKASFAEAAPQPESLKKTGASIILAMKGKLGHLIVLTVGKEDGVFKIRDMKINEPGATRKR
jgi:hypothetical protein